MLDNYIGKGRIPVDAISTPAHFNQYPRDTGNALSSVVKKKYNQIPMMQCKQISKKKLTKTRNCAIDSISISGCIFRNICVCFLRFLVNIHPNIEILYHSEDSVVRGYGGLHRDTKLLARNDWHRQSC